MSDALIDFYIKSNGVTLFVLALLALYFILLNWSFLYRYFTLSAWLTKESRSLESLLMGAKNVSDNSYLSHFFNSVTNINNDIVNLSKNSALKDCTKGLSTLSIIASTSPFIGLFGTVVSILDTFSNIGQSSGTMAIIAAGVSDALIATAAGIFVAIFAYTYHQVLKRKAYDLHNIMVMQGDALLSRDNTEVR
jgi:biopolymer transport protein ExbB/TolQ